MKNVKKKAAVLLIALGFAIPSVKLSANAYENYKDNPIGLTYADDHSNLNYANYDLSSYALTWDGYCKNKETVSRKKFTTDSIYIYVTNAYYNDSKCNYYAVSAEQNSVGRDNSSYGTSYRKVAVGNEVLLTNYVREFAEDYNRLEVYRTGGLKYTYTKCNLSFSPLKSGGKTNKIEGLWSPDSTGDIRNRPEGTISSTSYPN